MLDTLTTETTPLLLPLQLPGLLFCNKMGECLQQQPPPPPPPGDLRCGVGGGTARLFERLRDDPGGGGAGTPEKDGEGDEPGLSLGEGSALRETVTPLWDGTGCSRSGVSIGVGTVCREISHALLGIFLMTKHPFATD